MTNSEIREFWANVVPVWALSEILFFIADRRIADAIGDGPADLATVAERTGTHPDSLRRVLNALTAHGIFKRVAGDRYSPTSLSTPLRSDATDSQRAYVALGRLMMHDAWSSLDATMQTGRPAFNIQFGEPAFNYMQCRPQLAAAFAEGMTSTTQRIERALAEAAPFGDFELVIDVGGSFGSLLRLLLAQNPLSRGIVFDRPEIAATAADRWAGSADSARLRAIGGDFFVSVPAGADLYLLKQILHDWQDEHCIAILRNVRSAMSAQARIAVVEMVLPADGSAHPGWMYDLLMMTMTGGRERNAKQYQQLLETAGFRVHRVIPTRSPLSIIEAEPD